MSVGVVRCMYMGVGVGGSVYVYGVGEVCLCGQFGRARVCVYVV